MMVNELPPWFVRGLAIVFASLWGSFANVVVYRWPREMSLAWPGSHCPHCSKPVRARDNVPVFAWLWLRGKCRDCGAPIAARYPLVEAVFAFGGWAIAERLFFGPAATTQSLGVLTLLFLLRFAVFFALMVAALIDLDEMLVPNFVWKFSLLPLIGAVALPVLEPSVDIFSAIAGAGLGYFGLRLLFIDGFELLTGRRGMGLGDAEILALVGALLGPSGVLFALGAGAIQGVAAAAIAKVLGKRIGPAHANDVEDSDHLEDEAQELPAQSTTTTSQVSANAPLQDDSPSQAALEPNDEQEPNPGAMKVPFVPFLALAAIEYLLGADKLVIRWLSPP